MALSVSFPTPHSDQELWLCHTGQWWPVSRAEPVGGGTSPNKPTSRKKGKQQLLALNASPSHLLSLLPSSCLA